MRVNRFFWGDFIQPLVALVLVILAIDGWDVATLFNELLLLVLLNSLTIAVLLSLLRDWQLAERHSLIMVVIGAFAAFGSSFIVFLLFGIVSGSIEVLSYFPGYLIVFGLAYFSSRLWSLLFYWNRSSVVPVIIYGAGSAGVSLAAALMSNPAYKLVGFVDDDPKKLGRRIFGKKVSSSLALARLKGQYDDCEVLLAMPSLELSGRKQIIDKLARHSFSVKTVPGLRELLSEQRALLDLKRIDVRDLLGREAVVPIAGLLEQCIEQKVVLVTGAGGSIGSEIARQVMRQHPRQLLLMDVSEAALYVIEQELLSLNVSLNCDVVPLLGSASDQKFVESIFAEYTVDTVYHAAAYKHVPLLEQNIVTGVCNNVLGTYRVLNAAANNGVDHFVLISTDKAVRPTNVMGASKRVAELLVQAQASLGANMRCSIVRFGNVLGSSGSVVPLFQRQIESGGPVTLTHEKVTRYFMTIPEASELVIQAGALSKGGEIFVLDMGESVPIMALAEKMIALSGKRVSRGPAESDDEIEIKVTGLRPGEKLYEELLISGDVADTAHPKIKVAVENFLPQQEVEKLISVLEDAALRSDVPQILATLTRVVDGFDRSGS